MTSTTQLFQADIDRKIVKEYTGHSSDAVNKYQIISHEQRKQVSEVIVCEGNVESQKYEHDQGPCDFVLLVEQDAKLQCSCKSKVLNVQDFDKLGAMFGEIVENRRGWKATVKLSIEFDC